MNRIFILALLTFSLIRISYAQELGYTPLSEEQKSHMTQEQVNKFNAQMQKEVADRREQQRIDEANKLLADQEKVKQEAAQQKIAEQDNSQNQSKTNQSGGGGMGALFFPTLLLGVLIYIGINKYNNLVFARQNVEQGMAQISVLLKRRHDLIPSLVEATKGYMGYEKDTLEKVTKARQTAVNAGDVNDKIKAENTLTATLRGFYAVAENYPNLKADQTVLQLQSQLTDTENKISIARQQYNNVVKQLNVLVQSFPDSIVAALGSFKKAPFFQGETEEEKSVPQVKLEQKTT